MSTKSAAPQRLIPTAPKELDPRTISAQAQERFWAKVAKAGPDDCWDWTSALNAYGYGHFSVHHGRVLRAPRLAWSLANERTLPSGLHILHSCDRPACCNPSHLRPGTSADNVADMDSRGRRVVGAKPNPGELNPAHKLTDRQVLDIRAMSDSGVSNRIVGRRFGVSASTVSNIRTRKSWSHLADEAVAA